MKAVGCIACSRRRPEDRPAAPETRGAAGSPFLEAPSRGRKRSPGFSPEGPRKKERKAFLGEKIMHASRILLAAAIAAAFATAASAEPLTGTLKKAADTGTFTIGYREASVPFSYLNSDGKPVGYGVEICKKVADAVSKTVGKKLTLKWIPITSGNRIPLLQNGTYDIECGSTTNSKERQKQVSFGTNYFRIQVTAGVKAKSPIKTFADLKGKTVVTTAGTTSVGLINGLREKGIPTRMITGKDHTESFQLLSQDRAVAFIMDDILIVGQIEK